MKKILFSLSLLMPSFLWAQWNNNPAINTPVCVTTGSQTPGDICIDGSGGALIVWGDSRSGTTNPDIYIQHLDSTGTALWTTNGVPVCTAPSYQSNPQIVTDGAGGAFIFWQDARSGTSNWKLYAQHINAAGTALWTADGIELTSFPNSNTTGFKIASDNNGGVIFCWNINGTSTGTDVVAQRLDNNGNTLWSAGGLLLCNAVNNQSPFGLIADADGGAIVAWVDLRNGNTDLFAQRVDASGTILWITNGADVCTESHGQNVATIIPDQHKGAIVSWQDERLISGQLRPYVQHLDSSGNKLWATDGISLSSTHSNIPVMATDNTGGAIVTWYDSRNFYNSSYRNNDIYAQRINAAGVTQWTTGGAIVCNDSLEQSFPIMVNDGNSGAVILWSDAAAAGSGYRRAQRIDANGNTVWPGYVTYCTAPSQSSQKMIRSNSNVIVTWADTRSGNQDIYATRFSLIGSNPIPLPVDISSFSGQAKGTYNLLTWITASENNNKGFAIERSNNATDFREIGFVKGSGTTTAAITYHFRDEQPATGKNFYRLKQTDFDERSKYSTVVELVNTGNTTAVLYPNPASGEIKVVAPERIPLSISDMYSRKVRSSFTNQTINISTLLPGLYYCRLGDTVLPFIKKAD